MFRLFRPIGTTLRCCCPDARSHAHGTHSDGRSLSSLCPSVPRILRSVEQLDDPTRERERDRLSSDWRRSFFFVASIPPYFQLCEIQGQNSIAFELERKHKSALKWPATENEVLNFDPELQSDPQTSQRRNESGRGRQGDKAIYVCRLAARTTLTVNVTVHR